MEQTIDKLVENGRFSEIFKRLTRDQRRFIGAMQHCKNKKEAAEEIGVGQSTVYNWPKIVDEAIDFIDKDIVDCARQIRKQAIIDAVEVKIAGLKSDNERIKQNAATEIIEAELGRSPQSIDVTSKGERIQRRIILDELSEDELNRLAEIIRNSQTANVSGD